MRSLAQTVLPSAAGCLLGGGNAFAAAYPTILWMRHAKSRQVGAPTHRAVAEANLAAAAASVVERSALRLDTDSHLSLVLIMAFACFFVAALPAHTASEFGTRLQQAQALAKPVCEEYSSEAAAADKLNRKELLRLRKSWDARLQWRERKRRKSPAKSTQQTS